RLRRECRTLWHVSLVAAPLWAGLIVWVQAAAPDDSTAWNLADEAVGPGLLVIGALFVVGLLATIVLGLATGIPGKVAAAFVPFAGRGREATVDGDADAMAGLLPRLRRKPWVSVGLVLMFFLFTALGAVVGMNLVPVYQANNGHGGMVVTVGRDATPDGYEDSGDNRDYYLSTPDGRVLAQDHRPQNGQQWLVRRDPLGNDEAYLIGGHDYLLVGALLLFAAVADAVLLLSMFGTIRRERRMRRAGGHVPLAYSVRKLAAGARPVLRFDLARSVMIGLPPLPDDSDTAARALLARRRWHVALTAVVVVGVAAGAGVIINRATQPPPPTDKDITLSYLGPTSWSTDTEAFYTDTDAIHDVAVDMLRDGGVTQPAVGPVWSLIVSQRQQNDQDVTANVDVVGIGSAPARQAVAGGIAFQKEVADKGAPPPVAVTGLPAGWAGVLTDGKKGSAQRTAAVFGAAGGTLVDISVEGTSGDADLSRRVRELATAIAGRGLGNFVSDTAR
ncbi:MAG TPA: hypothetical protein VHF06_09845, partial [Pseudonocardiaceae bacterium]|nr:hypothetical protein [Pseudonocardiaceae bacterium]